jgi:hypothetical protein
MSTCKIITKLNNQINVSQINNLSDENFVYTDAFKLKNGWQKITITSSSPTEIVDILIDNYSLNEILYTSWGTDKDGNILNPCTYVDENITWSIILHDNIGFFKAHISTEILNGYYQNLYEQYYSYTDVASYKLKKYYNSQINSFFEYDTGINFFKKDNLKSLPYISLNLKYDSELLFNDIQTVDFNPSSNVKQKDWVINSNFQLNKIFKTSDLPYKNLVEFLLQYDIDEITGVFMSAIKPNGIIEMHIDNGLNKIPKGFNLHIPIFPTVEAPFKMFKAGIIPPVANLVNNELYPHCVVNETEKLRYAILVMSPKLNDEKFIKKHINLKLVN